MHRCPGKACKQLLYTGALRRAMQYSRQILRELVDGAIQQELAADTEVLHQLDIVVDALNVAFYGDLFIGAVRHADIIGVEPLGQEAVDIR